MGTAFSFSSDAGAGLARQVRNALEDGAAQPLVEVQRSAPDDCHYFSELESSLGEWSFAYGVAWALMRMRDPLLSSSATDELAREATREAWRSFSPQTWRELMETDRRMRGPVGEQEALSGFDEFMGKMALTRASRPAARRTGEEHQGSS